MTMAVNEQRRSSSSKDGFKEYLKNSGVLELITSALGSLYEQRESAGDPMVLLKKTLIEEDVKPIMLENSRLELENVQLKNRVEYLEDRLRLIGVVVPTARPILKASSSESMPSIHIEQPRKTSNGTAV
eukprot:CFRG0827T1